MFGLYTILYTTGFGASPKGGFKMAGLIKRGNTYYSVYYIGDKQKRRSLKTDSLQVAEQAIRDLETSIYLLFRGHNT